MKVYIPFDIIVDTDFGIIRMINKLNGLESKNINKIKSFLIKRTNPNPVEEYCELESVTKQDITYDEFYNKMMSKEHYRYILLMSEFTDMLSFIINTSKLGLNSEVFITIACNNEEEVNYLSSKLSKLKMTPDIRLSKDIDINDYEYIFVKYLNDNYIKNLEDNGIRGKRLYVADYGFNTIYDEEIDANIVLPMYHIALESLGIAVCTVSLYNKKQEEK